MTALDVALGLEDVDVLGELRQGRRELVLEYHRIQEKESNYTRSIENFKKDLETMYQKGYRLVKFHDLMGGKVDVPAGMTPVVFSFDDSTESQFRYLKQGDKTVIDPDCALGMMDAFYKTHKDFGYTALFNYLPELFDQPKYKKEKVDYLYQQGFEFGDHTRTAAVLCVQCYDSHRGATVDVQGVVLQQDISLDSEA